VPERENEHIRYPLDACGRAWTLYSKMVDIASCYDMRAT